MYILYVVPEAVSWWILGILRPVKCTESPQDESLKSVLRSPLSPSSLTLVTLTTHPCHGVMPGYRNECYYHYYLMQKARLLDMDFVHAR